MRLSGILGVERNADYETILSDASLRNIFSIAILVCVSLGFSADNFLLLSVIRGNKPLPIPILMFKFAPMDANDKPLILISNDDGLYAKGIAHLVSIVAEIGEVVVVTPNRQRSGQSHAITVHEPLHYEAHPDVFGDLATAYTCSGTPADCVKIALNQILDRKPTICLSGINHGTNASIGVLYSGTIAAALEAAIKNISAIAFSVDDHSPQADFSQTDHLIKNLVTKTLKEGLPAQTALNVNFPKANGIPYKGVTICRQTKGIWEEKFENRTTPWGMKYHWLYGDFKSLDSKADNDIKAVEEHRVAVVPIRVDMTDYNSIEILKNWKLCP